MTAESSREPEDPLKGASDAFEEHERALMEEAMARLHRDIPAGATVAEAVEEMRRAMAEDEDARELLLRMVVLQNHNHGYIRNRFDEVAEDQEDGDVKYTAAIGGRPISEEELDLMMQLGAELERRLPSDLPEAEREARVPELLQEDEELATLVARLKRLQASGPVAPEEQTDDEDEDA
jgi:hypothetical protein